MKLIVDSGSTKTDWCFAESCDSYTLIKTDGINPAVQSIEEIRSVVQRQMLNEVIRKSIDCTMLESVSFYGAGCNNEFGVVVEHTLRETIGEKVAISVDSDLLAAARALCGMQSGIACILGTGSNSCFFDGSKIQKKTPALGYILGDEGSGSVLGRLFLNGILKGTLPTFLREEFFDEYGLNQADIIKRVYHSPMPNRFLASLSKFVLPRIDNEALAELVTRNFESFIVNNLHRYSNTAPVINAVGSMAFFYRTQLEQAAKRHGYRIGKILKSPLEGLLEYHFANK